MWVCRRHPRPGDLILVHHSDWYALPDGGTLRVCEEMGWATKGSELVVAPRHRVSTFWGPVAGGWVPDRSVRMSTSGGPFKRLSLARLRGLRYAGLVRDTFWNWRDVPRAGGGVERAVEVHLWIARTIDVG